MSSTIEIPLLGDIPAQQFYATRAGEQWLSEHPGFRTLVGAFIDLEDQQGMAPERAFADVPFVGTGVYSEVRDFEGVAVKLSTDTTGSYDGRGLRENLLDQFTVLGALRSHLDERPEHGITAPSQLLAMRTPQGNFIQVEELKSGWTNLRKVITVRRIGDDQEHEINEAVKARINSAVGKSVLRRGIKDLGLSKKEYLHSKNVMVQTDTEELAQAEVCIIDQPQIGASGRLIATILRRTRSQQPLQSAEAFA